MSIAVIPQGDVSVDYRWIHNFPGYAAGNDGSIWSCRRTGPKHGVNADKWRKLQGGTDADGYKKIILCNSAGRRYVKVHQLILETFVGQCPPGYESRHVDGNRQNNTAGNLLWSTHKANCADRQLHGTHRNGNKVAKVGASIVAEIARLLQSGEAKQQLAKQFGISISTVKRIQRKQKLLIAA